MSAPSPLTLIHFGDLHLWRFGLDGDFFPKRFLGLANLALRRGRAFPESVARAVVKRIASETADWLLFAGDLATTSLVAEFVEGRRLFQPLFDRWGKRFIAIPGNHDRYTPRAAEGYLFEMHFLRAAGVYPFARDLNDHWTAIGYDCSLPRRIASTGRVDRGLVDALREMLRGLRGRHPDRRLLVMGHYPLVYPDAIPPKSGHALSESERQSLLDLFDEYRVALFLHGHKHNRWLLRRGETLHLNCGSAGMLGRGEDRRPGYLKVRLPAAPDDPAAAEIVAHWLGEVESSDCPIDEGWRSKRLDIAV